MKKLFWSVRRELWENRSITLATPGVAGLALVAFIVAVARTAVRPANQIDEPYSAAAFVVVIASMLIGAFYCMDALHGERRDRGILFWKSLPISDGTAVLAKMAVPMVVLPAYALALVFVDQLVMRLIHTGILWVHGANAADVWLSVPVAGTTLRLAYGLAALALWHAPLYGWFLLASAWARRAPILWALLPPLSLAGLERVALGSTNVLGFLQHRVVGICTEGFTDSQMEPLKFLASPGLWLGLAVAAAFLGAAARLRRHRRPL